MSSARRTRCGKNKQSNISVNSTSSGSCASTSKTPFSINNIFNSVAKKDTTPQESFKVRN